MTDIWTNAPEWTPPQGAVKGADEDLYGDAPSWNSHGKYDGQSKIHSQATIASVARQIPVGFNEGLADVAGAPVDATTWVMNHLAKAVGYGKPTLSGQITGESPKQFIENPVGGSEFFKSGLGIIGADPRATPAQNTPEEIARAT